MGNAHEIEYVVRAEKLHGGRNYGALKFVTPYETLTYEVEVLQNQEYDEDHRMPELLMAQIVKRICRLYGRKSKQRSLGGQCDREDGYTSQIRTTQ